MTIYGLEYNTHKAFVDNVVLLDFVYLDGDIQIKNEFDLVGVTEETYNFINHCEFGIFNVDVITHNGHNEQCVLFYWHDSKGRVHGLIVDKNDNKSINRANSKFHNTATVI